MASTSEFIVSVLALSAFTLVLYKAHFFQVVRNLPSDAMHGISAMLDNEIDDDSKELAVRKAGLALISATLRAGGRLILALVAAAVTIMPLGAVGMASPQDTVELMLSMKYIAGMSAAGILAFLVFRGRAGRSRVVGSESSGSYRFGDRFFHTLAFSNNGVQRIALQIDDFVFARRIASVPESEPIFLTSLARGGTTALLNAFHDMPGVGTHLYLDMPFVTAPLLWSKVSRQNFRSVGRRKRAHGDGFEIDLDSPEAFEEVLWKLYWPDHYQETAILPWTAAEAREEAQKAFEAHFKKIVLLRRKARLRADNHPVRYMSKNNANLARLDLPRAMFPNCDIVIALRRPGPHAASLCRQHRNFAVLHDKDHFARRYMSDIGHFEFGALHRPLAFEGFDTTNSDPEEPDYWLRYWIAAFRSVNPAIERCHVVSQDSLRAQPQATMEALANKLNIATGGLGCSQHFRSTPDIEPKNLFTPKLLAEADEIYDTLIENVG